MFLVCFCLLDVWILNNVVLFDVQCSCMITRHASHVTRHTSHVTRHSFDLRLCFGVWGLVYALCILMNISYYRYSIFRGGGGVVVTKPLTSNPKHQTLNLKPQTLNTKHPKPNTNPKNVNPKH